MTASDLFWGTSGPRDAKIAIIGEAWGADEAAASRPFVGESGRELNRMLAEAGINRDECFCSNLVSERPPSNDIWRFFHSTTSVKELKLTPFRGLYPKENVLAGINRLGDQLDRVRPELIVCCGNYPLWALTDQADITNLKPKERNPDGWSGKVPGGIGKQRGSMLRARSDLPFAGTPVLPIYHPAAILRNWSWRAVTVHDLKLRVPLRKSWEKPQWHYELCLDFNTAIQSLTKLLRLMDEGPVGCSTDLETRNRCIASIAMTADGHTALAIPFMRPSKEGMQNWWTIQEESSIVRLLREIFHHPNCRRIGQYFLYDSQYMSHWWRVEADVYFDTMLGQHLLFPGTPKALYYLASIYCDDYYAFWKEDSNEWEGDLDIRRLLVYNCDDVIYTWKIADRLRSAITAAGRMAHYDFLLEQWHLSFEMMERGILVDQKIRSEMSERVSEAATARQEWLNQVVPEWCRPPVGRTAKPWFNSPKQQQQLFYDMLGCKSIHNRKTGNVSIDDEALKELKLRYPELTRIVDTIGELRSLGVFQNNFLSAAIDPDGRMRSSFNVATVETFRWSSSENAFRRGTNLQNIPKGDE